MSAFVRLSSLKQETAHARAFKLFTIFSIMKGLTETELLPDLR
jgi:hypothetical protein